MEEGIKYPKSIIERFDIFEKECNIEEFNLSIFKDSWYNGDNGVRIVGEIIGEALPHDLIIIASAYNEEGAIIGSRFDEKVNADGFEGIYSFSINMRIAGNENIEKIRVYPMPNPTIY